MDSDYERIRQAIEYIQENAGAQPSLDDVAAHVGLSSTHLQRVFTQWAGVSPKRFLQALTASRAKELLRSSESVLDAAFTIGLSGSGRLHDLMVTTEGVTPGEYKTAGAGLTIRYGIHATPFGQALIGVTDRGVCALRFIQPNAEDDSVAELRSEWRNAELIRDQNATAPWVARIFDTRSATSTSNDWSRDDSLPLPLLLKGTNFQIKVWEGLLRVPEGAVISYGALAERLGVPSSARAVANAIGANPIGYIIPCHRVLRSSGALGGYRWGVDRKTVMLDWELSR